MCARDSHQIDKNMRDFISSHLLTEEFSFLRISSNFKCKTCSIKIVSSKPSLVQKYISDDCPICLETISKRMHILKCKHVFHEPCIARWKAEGNRTCPCCRSIIKFESFGGIDFDYVLENLFTIMTNFRFQPSRFRSYNPQDYFVLGCLHYHVSHIEKFHFQCKVIRKFLNKIVRFPEEDSINSFILLINILFEIIVLGKLTWEKILTFFAIVGFIAKYYSKKKSDQLKKIYNNFYSLVKEKIKPWIERKSWDAVCV